MITRDIIVHADPDLEDEVNWYVRKLQEHLKTARKATSDADFKIVQRIGHRIKGSAPSFGFDVAGKIGQHMERSAKKKNIKAVNQSLSLLVEFLDRVEVVVDL